MPDDPGLFDANDTPRPTAAEPRPAPVASTAYAGPAADVLPDDLARLLTAELDSTGGRELVDLVVAAERSANWASARSNELMAALAVPGVPGPTGQLGRRILHPEADPADIEAEAEISAVMEWEAVQRLAADQLAAVLVQSPITMRIRVNQAHTMVHDFHVTQAALAQGKLCRSKAAVVLDRLQFVSDPAVRRRLEERAAEAAGGRAPGRLGALLDRWVVAADPDAAERRRKAARVARKVTHRALADGMGRLSADLPADSSQTIHDLLTEAGRVTQGLAGDGDRRTLDQCRADLLSDIMLTLAAGDSVSMATLLAAAAATGVADGGAGHPDITETDDNSAAADRGDGQPDIADTRTDIAGAAGGEGDGRPVIADTGTDSDAAVAEEGVDLPDIARTGTDADVTTCSDPAVDEPRTCQAGSDGAEADGRQARLGWADPAEPWTAAALGIPSYSSPKRQGRPLHTVITMTLDAFARLSRDPASLVGYGTITAEWAQVLAEAARTVSLLITDENGHALDASAYVYRPRQQVRDQVRTMNPTCVFTTCNKPAHGCDNDHRQTFCQENPAAGGLTTSENLEPLCRKHHQAKTHGGWRSERNPDNTRTFISPLGIRTVSPAADHPTTPSTDPPF